MFEAYFRIKVEDNRKIRAAWKALHPDNMVTPGFMEINEEISENEYIIKIKIKDSSPKHFDGLRGTLDDIACMFELIEEMIKYLKIRQNS